MTDTFTKEDVECFVERIRIKLMTLVKESSALSDSYLDDSSDRGLKGFYFHKGASAGTRGAIGIVNRETEKFLEGKK